MGNPDEQDRVKQTLELLQGMQRMRLVPTDATVTEQGITLTGITKWEEPLDELRAGAR
jgi:hypothetical protein